MPTTLFGWGCCSQHLEAPLEPLEPSLNGFHSCTNVLYSGPQSSQFLLLLLLLLVNVSLGCRQICNLLCNLLALLLLLLLHLLQLLLAVAAMSEVARRAWTGSYPDEMTMIGFSVLALIANVACLMLISKHRQGGVHMRASYIFSANDVLANVGVIVAALLVGWTGLPVFDWLIGAIISVIVLTGAIRILRLR